MQTNKSLSCAACRRRKVRCDRTSNESAGEGGPAAACIPCSRLEIECITPSRKRRGLATRTMADLRPAAQVHPRLGEQPFMAQNASRPSVEPADSSEQDQDVDLDDIFGEHVMNNVNSVPAGSIADALTGLDHSLVDYPQPSIGEHVTSAALLSAAPIGTSGSWAIETIIPRENVMYMVTMFFEFVYPLQPIVDQSTFTSRLFAQNDKHDVMFLSLLSSILAVSLIHVPKEFVPYDDSETIADIASRCLRLSRICVLDLYDPPSDTLVIIRYFHAVYYFMTGRRAAWVAALAESTRLALYMELHRELSYAGLDELSAEIRRRLIHTLLNADASAACMQDQSLALNIDDVDVSGPSDLENDFLPSQLASQRISRLIGFRASSSTLRLIRECLSIRRSLRSPQSVSKLLDMARELCSIHGRLQTLFSSLHPVLRAPSRLSIDPLNFLQTSPSSTSDSPGHTLIDDDRGSVPGGASARQEIAMTHQVMKANLHTTRAVARMLLINSREELLNNAGPRGSPGRKGIEAIMMHTDVGAETMEKNITDLLDALTSIPMQAVSANSHSLVNKVRSVVVTLLDSEQNENSSGPTGSAEQYEGVLLSFLTLLTQIENLCSVVPVPM